jgi:hypothetical protein
MHVPSQSASAPDEGGTRCHRCGAPIETQRDDAMLTLAEIMDRYKVKRTKALALRREARRRFPSGVRSHGRCVRVAASALDRVWKRG